MNRLLIFLILLTGQIMFAFNLKSSPVVNSVLSSGRWIKAQTSQSGLHQITFSALISMGFQSPQKVKFFGFPPGQLPQMNNIPVPDDLTPFRTWQTKDKQQNDCYMIYIPASTTWEFDHGSQSFIHHINPFAQSRTFLYLTETNGTAQSITTAPILSANPETVVNEFDNYGFYEEEKYNLIETGSRWFSALLTSGIPFNQTFKFADHVVNEPVKLVFSAAARCESSSTLSFSVNNATTETLSFAPYSNFAEADFADLRERIISKTIDGDDLSLSFKYNATANGMCWLDFIRVQTRCQLKMQSGQLLFRDSRSAESGKITEFRVGNAINGLKIWETTNPLKPIENPVNNSFKHPVF